ncbi:hypothetical protein TRFO_28937 [Tritrichomonas foetus]|uniref:non-specific serine/threonine protein kinase n=1 Tax=Tritrichomonas foetus TaxID=1144522 RepID=A0A1J4K1K3_9EUKA|nr:hypothetical protein TRFO_28937 [Tritrichomonas foetus]|eukprot:OHT03620.1 hypothetical protein TRFO_28937 [Tritrichomonas foetus]
MSEEKKKAKTFPVNTIIDGYRIIDVLGVGGYGEVYKVIDDSTYTIYALKTELYRPNVRGLNHEIQIIQKLDSGCFPKIIQTGIFETELVNEKIVIVAKENPNANQPSGTTSSANGNGNNPPSDSSANKKIQNRIPLPSFGKSPWKGEKNDTPKLHNLVNTNNEDNEKDEDIESVANEENQTKPKTQENNDTNDNTVDRLSKNNTTNGNNDNSQEIYPNKNENQNQNQRENDTDEGDTEENEEKHQQDKTQDTQQDVKQKANKEEISTNDNKNANNQTENKKTERVLRFQRQAKIDPPEYKFIKSNSIDTLSKSFSNSRKKYQYLLMKIYPPSIYDVIKAHKNVMDKTAVFHIALKMLKCIHVLHDSGFIHLDIKPANFMMNSDEEYPIVLIDFGMAMPITSEGCKSVNFVGTKRYASVNSHMKKPLGPADDLVSWFFVIMELFHNSLPWKNMKDKEEVRESKENDIDTLTDSSKNFMKIYEYCCNIQVNEKPDYEYIEFLLRNEMEKEEISSEFDWLKWIENEAQLVKRVSMRSRRFSLQEDCSIC